MVIVDKNDIDYGCYLSVYKLAPKIKFMSLSKMQTLLGRSEFSKLRKEHGHFCYYKFEQELVDKLFDLRREK